MPWLLDYLANQKQRRDDELQRMDHASKAATYYYKSLPQEEQRKLSPSETEWNALSLQDRSAAAAGHAAALHSRSTMAQIENYGALEDERRAMAEQRGRDQRDAGIFQGVMQGWTNSPAAAEASGDYGGEAMYPSTLPRMNPHELVPQMMQRGMSPYGVAKFGQIFKDIGGYGEEAQALLPPTRYEIGGDVLYGNPNNPKLGYTVSPSAKAEAGLDARLKEIEARLAPKAIAPAGAKPVVLNGIHYLEDESGNLYKVPQPRPENPLTELLKPGGSNAPAKPAAAGGNGKYSWKIVE